MSRDFDKDPDTRAWTIADGAMGLWPSEARTFISVSPEKTHDMIETGKDMVQEMIRRLGDEVQIHGVIHRHQGRWHYHFAVDRAVPQYKVERAVDAALERRHERTREWALEKQREEREQDRDGLER